ncbi:pyridoxal phosphate-dependent aminotransferase [Anaerosporobacter faecicola]|uniref:pyridoxal phosphate-dependent aminotransferase n=1 Tax=Anaerosporobacter faecicola TaxID=2718714 RepID=UPI00143C19DB|nr:histidinol-phosphate transaminase [Anaerosporobacter faecicola]
MKHTNALDEVKNDRQIYVHGGDIYRHNPEHDFSANINPLGVNEHIMKAAADSLKDMGNYPDVSCTKLRMELSKKLSINPDWLYFGNGAADVLFTLIHALKPKRALLLSPTFSEYEQALQSVDCSIAYYSLTEENAFTLLPDYLQLLTDELDLIILCNPNNPVGNTIPMSTLQAILTTCVTRGIRVIMDECFNDFLDNTEENTLTNELATYNNLCILKAFTKMYAMAGLRLGYLITSNTAVLAHMNKVSQPWSVSVPAQAAGVAAVHEDEYVACTKRYVRKERDYLCAELESMGIRVYKPEANYIFFHHDTDWYRELLKYKILIRDCSNYKGLTKGYYRIAVRKREENQHLIRVMKKIIANQEMYVGEEHNG